ncbi:MAG: hypothetical protein MUE30_07590, partial [Spirosomaceae bacterium]|nr:hypothetical protein [Spirosomataceae bacterium]
LLLPNQVKNSTLILQHQNNICLFPCILIQFIINGSKAPDLSGGTKVMVENGINDKECND